ncbi:MAG: glycosyltransferase involved in cell wall biosynthesis [Paraglaciecola sp.]
MKVSIITVSYNSASTIKDTIESVIAQTYENIEYIVVDGNSRDDTMDIVNSYSKVIDNVVSEPDKGIYDAMNKGVQLATGDIVGILNSDDFYETTTVIEDIVEHFNNNKSADVVFGDVVFVEHKNLKKVVRYYSSKKFKPFKLRFGWMPPHPATFIRKSVYNKYGLYKLGYKISSDYEMFVRLLMVAKLSFSRVDKIIVRMRSGGASTDGIQSSITLNKEIVKACRENGIYTNLFIVLLKMPFKLLELIKR